MHATQIPLLSALTQFYQPKLVTKRIWNPSEEKDRPIADICVNLMSAAERRHYPSGLGITDNESTSGVYPSNHIAQMWKPTTEHKSQRVVIIGDLLTGKTLTCAHMVHQWMQKEIWLDVRWVFWLDLDDLNQYALLAALPELVDIVARHCLGIVDPLADSQRAELQQAISQVNAVWIIENLRERGSHAELLLETLFKKRRVVLTTHLAIEAGRTVGRATILYTAPFTDAQKRQYIQQYFVGRATAQTDAKAVQTFLTEWPVFQRVSNSPANLELICRLQRDGLLASISGEKHLSLYQLSSALEDKHGGSFQTMLEDLAAGLLLTRNNRLSLPERCSDDLSSVPNALRSGIILGKPSSVRLAYYFSSDIFRDYYAAKRFGQMFLSFADDQRKQIAEFLNLNRNNPSYRNLLALMAYYFQENSPRSLLVFLKALTDYLGCTQDHILGCLEELKDYSFSTAPAILKSILGNITQRTFDPPLTAYPRLTSSPVVQKIMLEYAEHKESAHTAVEFFSQISPIGLTAPQQQTLAMHLHTEQSGLGYYRPDYYLKVCTAFMNVVRTMKSQELVQPTLYLVLATAIEDDKPFQLELFQLLSPENFQKFSVFFLQNKVNDYPHSKEVVLAIAQRQPDLFTTYYDQEFSRAKSSPEKIPNLVGGVLTVFLLSLHQKETVKKILLKVSEGGNDDLYYALIRKISHSQQSQTSGDLQEIVLHWIKKIPLEIRVSILFVAAIVLFFNSSPLALLSFAEWRQIIDFCWEVFEKHGLESMVAKLTLPLLNTALQSVDAAWGDVNIRQKLLAKIKFPFDIDSQVILDFCMIHWPDSVSPAMRIEYFKLLPIDRLLPLFEQPRTARSWHNQCIPYLLAEPTKALSLFQNTTVINCLTHSEKTTLAMALKNLIDKLSQNAKNGGAARAEACLAALCVICENWRPDPPHGAEFIQFFLEKVKKPGKSIKKLRAYSGIILLMVGKQLPDLTKTPLVDDVFKSLGSRNLTAHRQRFMKIFLAPELQNWRQRFYQAAFQDASPRVLKQFLDASEFNSSEYNHYIQDLLKLSSEEIFAWVKVFVAEASRLPSLWQIIITTRLDLLWKIIEYGQTLPPDFENVFSRLNDLEKWRFIKAVSGAMYYGSTFDLRLNPICFQAFCHLINQWLTVNLEMALQQLAYLWIYKSKDWLPEGLLSVSVPVFLAVFQAARKNHPAADLRLWQYFVDWAHKKRIIIQIAANKTRLSLTADGVREDIPLLPGMAAVIQPLVPGDNEPYLEKFPELLSRSSKIYDPRVKAWISQIKPGPLPVAILMGPKEPLLDLSRSEYAPVPTEITEDEPEDKHHNCGIFHTLLFDPVVFSNLPADTGVHFFEREAAMSLAADAQGTVAHPLNTPVRVPKQFSLATGWIHSLHGYIGADITRAQRQHLPTKTMAVAINEEDVRTIERLLKLDLAHRFVEYPFIEAGPAKSVITMAMIGTEERFKETVSQPVRDICNRAVARRKAFLTKKRSRDEEDSPADSSKKSKVDATPLSGSPHTLMAAPSLRSINLVNCLTGLANITVQQTSVTQQMEEKTMRLQFVLPAEQVKEFREYYQKSYPGFIRALEEVNRQSSSSSQQLVRVEATLDIGFFKGKLGLFLATQHQVNQSSSVTGPKF